MMQKNNTKPIVSTITPCFRMKKYLKKFLDELPQQTYFDNLEVVLDHNEPDEEEVKWVQDFQEKYPGKIQHIIIDKVDPIGTSMNRCILKSNGEILTIWNVDDLRTPDSIEKQVDQIINNNADIVYGDYKIVREFGSTEGNIVDHAKYGEEDFKKSMIFGPFVMFRKSLVQKSGLFDEQLKSGADFDLSIRLAYNGVAKQAEGSLGYYLNEGLGASTRPNSKQPIERTVIELRYGIFGKIDLNYVPKISDYLVGEIFYNGLKHKVGELVPNYDEILEKNSKLIRKSVSKTFLMNLIRYKELKNVIRKIIRR